MIAPILQRLSQTRVRLHQTIGELLLDPLLQLGHHRAAILLVMAQTLLRAHPQGLLLVAVNHPERIEQDLAFGRIDALQIVEQPASVRETIQGDHIIPTTAVGCQRVAHLKWTTQFLAPPLEQRSEILARVTTTGEKIGR